MKRARRWLGILADAVGLAVLAGIVALWPLGHWRFDALLWLRDTGRSFALASGGGQCFIAVSDPGLTIDQRPQWIFLRLDRDDLETMVDSLVADAGPNAVGRWGFRFLPAPASTGTKDAWMTVIALPHWLVSSVAAVLLLARGRVGVRQIQRRRRGLCRVCGYDLRESRELCPECGTAVPQRAALRKSAAGNSPSP